MTMAIKAERTEIRIKVFLNFDFKAYVLLEEFYHAPSLQLFF